MSRSTRHGGRRQRVVHWILIAAVAAGFGLGVYAAGVASPWIHGGQWLMLLFLGFGAVFSLALARIRHVGRMVVVVAVCATLIRVASLVSQRIEFEQRRWLVEMLRARILTDRLRASTGQEPTSNHH